MSKIKLTRSTSPAPRAKADRANAPELAHAPAHAHARTPGSRSQSEKAGKGKGMGMGRLENGKTSAAPEAPKVSFGQRLEQIRTGKAWPRVIGGADPMLFGAVIALIVLGVVMVYSASSVRAVRVFGDGHHYLLRQAAYAAIGLPLLLVLARLDYHFYRPFAKPVLALAVGLLLLVIFGLGHNAGGASRWIQVGPVNVQPAEVTKLALILWLADSLAKKVDRIRSFSVGFLPHVLIAGFLVALCMAQPDFGSSVILMLLTFVLLFTAGAKIGYMLAGAVIVLPIAFLLVRSSEYRWQRIIAFTDPLKYRMTGGYQIVESWMSFGAGGVSGVGLGDSRQKMLFLPEAHTDFIAAIVAEELGFVGFCALVLAFVTIVVRGARAALRSVDDYGTYLAIGLTMFIGIQAVTNLAVVLGLLPTKGLTLPFMSFGGSSLLVNCSAVGILLNISRPRLRSEGVDAREPNAGDMPGLGSIKGSSVREKNRRTRESLGESSLTGGAR